MNRIRSAVHPHLAAFAVLLAILLPLALPAYVSAAEAGTAPVGARTEVGSAFPWPTWADDITNPLENETAKTTAVAMVQSLRFWVWIAAGAGFGIYMVCYFAQGIVPQLFQQYRDYLRTGALLMLVFGVALTFIINQAGTATGQ